MPRNGDGIEFFIDDAEPVREQPERPGLPDLADVYRRRKENKEFSPGTFGIEIEVNNIQHLNEELPDGWSYTNDISVQSKAPLLEGKPVISKNKNYPFMKNPQRVGKEIVSPVLSDFKEIIEVLDYLKESGVKTESRDCGIHLHVSFPRGEAVVPLFKLALKYEPIFYAMGTFGGFSRGRYKDYIYQRPLLYPPIVKMCETNRALREGDIFYGHIFNSRTVDDISDEEDFQHFLARKIGGRYHAAKYCGINFYSIYYRGTVEFRTFNLTTNYSYVKSAINFCRDFAFAGVREFYSSEEEETEINFINDTDKGHILELFEEFIRKYSNFLDDEDVFTLRRLIVDSPPISIPEKVMFHLLYHRNGDNTSVYKYARKKFLPEKESEEDAIHPKPERLNEYEF